jgi:hypothetical protein
MSFDASLAATAVGSFPHSEAAAACDLILANFPEVPMWPQLPRMGLTEQMEIQFSEGLPRAVIDPVKQRMYFDTAGDPSAALETFYENYLAENVDHFAISEPYSRGIFAMKERLARKNHAPLKYFKMQVTGPVSFGLTVVDENKRAIYYNEMFRDVVVKGLAMKARWQLRQFAPCCQKRICFIDEPILSAFGSSTYVSVRREDVVAQIQEVVEAIHAEGGLAGIHCCGNTEWTIPMDAKVDIINFDAYAYGSSIVLYAERIGAFLEQGGVLAWGIVPTAETIDRETTDSLADRFDALVGDLAVKGVNRDLVLHNALITASCGTGSIPLPRAERVIQETRRVSDRLKQRARLQSSGG